MFEPLDEMYKETIALLTKSIIQQPQLAQTLFTAFSFLFHFNSCVIYNNTKKVHYLYTSTSHHDMETKKKDLKT